MTERRIEYVRLDAVLPALRNPKSHSPDLAASISRFGFTEPVVMDERTGRLVAGHGRLESLTAEHASGASPPDGIEVAEDGAWLLPVVRGWASRSEADAEGFLLASNRIGEIGGWDDAMLAELLRDYSDVPDWLDGTGYSRVEFDALLADHGGTDDDGLPLPAPDPEVARQTLAERFLVPPFSVLDARQGYWQTRKRAWLSLGIRSELGRGDRMTFVGGGRDLDALDDTSRRILAQGDPGGTGTSIFDPVLCELAYRWFCPPGGRVLDPFAGGSVRGVVASLLGRTYKGVDLSEAQLAANAEQLDLCSSTLTDEPATPPEWYVGDSRTVSAEWPPAPEPFDLVFSCPPYFDLEVYTDSPDDLSQAPDVDAFVDGLAAALTACVARLADDRFVVLVMGEARDKKGTLYGLIPGTVEAARRAGLRYHNEAILVTMVGSLPLRVGKSFPNSRKLGRTHQTMLVFVKGDAVAAAKACGPVEVADLAEQFGTLEE